MQVLLDTNILIKREDYDVISPQGQELFRLISRLDHKIVIHPLSKQELAKDKDSKRRKIGLSKIGTYDTLEQPPNPENDKEFLDLLGISIFKNHHEFVDCNLIYCIYKNAADFLITEDKGILKKSEKVGVFDRIFDVTESLKYFKKLFEEENVEIVTPPAIQNLPMHNLDLKDPFFDSLKEDYGEKEFTDWWKKISLKNRKAWTYFIDDKIGAILMYKKEEENEDIGCDPPLPKCKKVKICTLKVTHYGFNLGELFIKLAINFAIKSKIDNLYLTHFTKDNDRLIPLIEKIGFEKYGIKPTKRNGVTADEEVYFKRLLPDKICKTPMQIQNKFYPSFYDGEQVNKFIVPIWPKFHDKLFTGYPIRQVTLFEMSGGFIIEGNTIKKIYLSHSKLKKIKEGDLLIFYRSKDTQQLTSIGVIEKVIHDISDPNRIVIESGKRTVYSRGDIEGFARKPTKIIFFNLNFHFPNPIKLKKLINEGLINDYPPSIRKISSELYIKIKELSGINNKYCINKLEVG